MIEVVLEKIANRPDADANIAARKIEQSGADISLLITREPGFGGRVSRPITVALVEDSDKARFEVIRFDDGSRDSD